MSFLTLEKVGVSLGGRAVVADVDASLAKGRFIALVGPNGAGKTSLLRAVAGLVTARGRVTLDGQDLAGLSLRQRALRIGYLPQGHVAHWPLPARDIVALGRFPHGATDPSRLTARDREAVEAAMAATGTVPFAERAVTTLSGGERARVALARVLALGAELILADEATASLDPHYQLEVMRVLKGVAAAGALVIAVTHDLGMAMRAADEILVLDQGRVAAHGAPADALSAEVLAKVFRIAALRGEANGQPYLVPWREA